MEKSAGTNPAKLWSRDFSLLIFGQVVSIFGNMVLTFALPLYILEISNSPALFGFVLGVSNIPLLLMSPVGGMIADRFRKQRVMFWLDVATTALIVAYIAVATGGLLLSVAVPIVIVKLMALNGIQAVYMSSVQAAIPSLVPAEKIVPANSAAQLVNAFSNMAGMAVAGILFARFGLMPVLYVAAACFAGTAVMDLLIRIPFKKQESAGGIVRTVKSDMALAAKFIFREKPVIAHVAAAAFMLNVSLTSMVVIGLPVIVTQHLGFGMDYVGASQSAMMGGSLLGGIVAGVLGGKIKFDKTYLFLLASGLAVLPMGAALLFAMPPFAAYMAITVSVAVSLAFIMPASILIVSYVQAETPVELVGKVMSLIVVLPFLANALGQLAYGAAFEWLRGAPWAVVFATVALASLTALYTKKHIRQ